MNAPLDPGLLQRVAAGAATTVAHAAAAAAMPTMTAAPTTPTAATTGATAMAPAEPVAGAGPDALGRPGPADNTGRGVQRHLWHSRFGTIVIEVQGQEIRVNGQRVAPHAR